MSRSLIRLTILSLALPTVARASGEMDVYFAPQGGFSEKNRDRSITYPDGTKVAPTMANSLKDMILRAEPGGQIKICMYAFGDIPTVELLCDSARDKGISVRLLLDAVAEWTVDLRKGLLEKVAEERKAAEKDKKPFDFQVRLITPERMVGRKRTKVMENGDRIYGTMHEKFGIFYPANSQVPFDSFAGSSNISAGADNVFAENRMYFRGRPAVARQFQEEFARLWNEYGTCPPDDDAPCDSENYVEAKPVPGEVAITFNAEPYDETRFHRIDRELQEVIDQVRWKGGSLDLAMFSITHRGLATAIVQEAIKKPAAQFRILLDQSMIMSTESHSAVLGPWFEEQIEKNKLKNMEVRYKWRSSAYGYDEEEKAIRLVHFRSLLLHHKLLMVNGQLLATGSYNWSSSAEDRNFENIMMFDRRFPDQGGIIDRFQAEFDTIWDSMKPEGRVKEPIREVPQTVDGKRGREIATRILKLLEDDKNLQIVQALYQEHGKDEEKFLTQSELQDVVKMSASDLKSRLEDLMDATLICKYRKSGDEGYSLAD